MFGKIDLQMILCHSGPEGTDHDGEDGHEEDNDQAGVEAFLILT